MDAEERQEANELKQALVEMANGTYTAEGNLIDYTLYDTAQLVSTRLKHKLFAVPAGQNDPVTGVEKDGGDTNVEQSNAIATGQKLMIQWFKIFYVGDSAKNEGGIQFFHTMLDQTVWNFKITNKDTYGNWKLLEMFGMSIAQVMTPAVPGDNSVVLNQSQSFGVFPLQLPIVLAQLTGFNVFITHTTAPNAALDGDRITVGLCGAFGKLG